MARYDLALSDREFLGMTMRQFQVLADRLNQQRQREDFRAGQIAAAVINSQRVKGRPSRPSDFFPSLKELDKPRQQSPAEMLALLESIGAAKGVKFEDQ